MTGPIDTIRHALSSGQWGDMRDALAALTELEHQLAAGRQDEQIEADVGEHYREERDQERARAVAAETALAEANAGPEKPSWTILNEWRKRAEAAERRANALEERADRALTAASIDHDMWKQRANDLADLWLAAIQQHTRWSHVFPATIDAARAALDRHTQGAVT